MRAKPTPRSRAHFVVAATLCIGCGGGGDDGDDESSMPSCAFEVSVTGAFSDEFEFEEAFCVYSTSFDSGVSVGFAELGADQLTSVSLQIEEIMIDEVGEFPAIVTVNHEDGRRFRAEDCSVDVATHEPDPEGNDDLGLGYQITGSGSCASPAEEMTNPSDTVTISEFRFSAPTSWGE